MAIYGRNAAKLLVSGKNGQQKKFPLIWQNKKDSGSAAKSTCFRKCFLQPDAPYGPDRFVFDG